MENKKCCSLCHRVLSVKKDPLSVDIGGDCIFCMIREETAIGDFLSAAALAASLTHRLIAAAQDV